MTGDRLVVFGNAEMASLARYYFENDSDHEIVAFTVDDAYAETDTHEGLPLVRFSEVADRYPPGDFGMHVALSYRRLNQLRQEKYESAKALGYELASYVSSKSVTWPDLTHGDNCFILENQTVQPTVSIGNNVMIWSGNHIGHGTRIRDHVYIASHVCISGHCDIGERSFFGVNAATRDFATIGSDCFVAMSCAVTRDLEPGSVVLGARSEVFGPDDPKAKKFIDGYFFS